MSEADEVSTNSSSGPRIFVSRKSSSHMGQPMRYNGEFDMDSLANDNLNKYLKNSVADFLSITNKLSVELMKCDIKAGPDVFSELEYWERAKKNTKHFLVKPLKLQRLLLKLVGVNRFLMNPSTNLLSHIYDRSC
ncbi:MAG: hypothetical protein ACKO0V_03325 [bacterium]